MTNDGDTVKTIKFIYPAEFSITMDYERLLEKAEKEMPKSVSEKERFEIPKVRGHIQGNKTIISNFHQIANAINRDVNHMLKYVLRELAAPGALSKTALIIGTKVSASRINEKIKKYVNEFVLCPECGKPDTKIEKEKNFLFLKCTACGARHVLKTKI